MYEEKFSRGKEWYEREFFSEWKNEKAVGEVDPAMLFEEKSAERILETLGAGVKLIFIFRNPVARAYSHFLMSQRKGFEELSFEQAGEKEEERLRLDPEKKYNYSYFSRGYYSAQVERFLRLFPKENMLFIVFEDDLIKNRKATFERIQDFLGVPPAALDLDIRSNEAATPKNKMVHELTRKKNPVRSLAGQLLPKKVRRKIQQFLGRKNSEAVQTPRLEKAKEQELIHRYFISDIHRLEKLIDRDLSSWYS